MDRITVRVRKLEAELPRGHDRPTGPARRVDHVGDRAPADLDLECRLVHDVPGAAPRLPRDRLYEIGLGPGDRIGSELLAVLVEHERVAAVQLGELDEAFFGNVRRRRGHRPAVELVEPVGERGAALEAEAKAVAGAPGVGAVQNRLLGDVAVDELSVALESAGREDERIVRGWEGRLQP